MRARLSPSIPDLLFCAILLWLFASGAGWSVLLADGDTGWHIRSGEEILKCRCIPHTDAFAFGTEGRPWYAWEWLADVTFAALRLAGGLKAVVLFAGIVIAAVPALLFRHMRWKGSGLFISLAVAILATGASSVHFLARPHIFTLLFTVISAWMLDRDRRAASRWIWALPPLVALWTNLHGGFLVIFTLLAARLVQSLILRARLPGDVGQALTPAPRVSTSRQALTPAHSLLRRDAVLTGACALATLLNPYGWGLHRHIVEYLRSDWIRQTIEEFQSPKFRSESMLQFELLLVLGIAILPALWRQRNIAEACLILFWAQQSLASVRHVPIYCLIAAPTIALQLEKLWSAWTATRPARSLAGMLREIDTDWKRLASGFSALPAAVCLALILIPQSSAWPHDFPAVKFPTELIARNSRLLAHSPPARIFSSDQWSDYLIYRLYPGVRTFFDGRSDFFGPWRGNEYSALMEGRPGCAAILDREKIRFALVPSTWALAGLLASSPQWKRIDGDRQAVLFERGF